MKAMLFAAGLGTRLYPLTEFKPKALVEVGGKTLLERNVELLVTHGFNQIIVNAHHFANQVIEYSKTLPIPNVEIAISDETPQLLDTGGGLKKASPFFNDGQPFLVMNADVVTNTNLTALLKNHQKSGAIATLAVRNRPSNRSFLFNNQQQLCGWQDTKKEKLRLSRDEKPLIPLAFSGIQVLSPEIFSWFPNEPVFSLVDLYLEVAKTETIIAFAHDSNYWFDAGSVEKLKTIEQFLSNSK